jgi:glycosyltransferase involved in cell wall biosynthesis
VGVDLSAVSVIIPCWNAERFVARAIESVLNQNCESTEIIVIDDGSTDRSVDVLKTFSDRIIWRTGPNRGACAARNAGLALARSEYVLFLDADDYLEGPYIQGLAQAAHHGAAELAVGPCFKEQHGTRSPYGQFCGGNSWRALLKQVVTRSAFQTSQMLFRRTFLNHLGGWDTLVEVRQDVELAIRALLAKPRTASSTGGATIWHQYQSNQRVSSRAGAAALASDLRWFNKTLMGVAELGDTEMNHHIAQAYYQLAYVSLTSRQFDIGKSALRQSRMLGFKGHTGGALRRLVRGAIGLERERQLTRRAKAILRRPTAQQLRSG